MKKKLILSLIALSLMTISSYAVNEITSSPSVNRVALPDFSPIYDSVGKSVVNITVTQAVPGQMPGFSTGDPFFDYFLRRMVPPQQQRQYKAHGLGSGFIISADGYILTNAHVVANAEQVVVKLNNKREFKAKIIGIDRDTDVAVLKIAAAGLPVVKFGDPNKMKPGNWVLAIGAPFGLENTITQGIISALSRDLPDDSYVPFIQTDVPINPGNSGGPLINLNGEIIGMNSQIYSKSGGYMGISFAIPIDYAVKVADQLKATGKVKRGRLGIAIQPITSELAKSFGLAGTNGALVNSVEANSAAAKAGLQVGDIILKINGQFITNSNLLPRLVGQLGPDKKLNLEVWRNGKTITLTAVTT
ncbi:MAG: Do family serine endopeptidase, partial [Burkholderiales bacterium]